jgi:hypothetical protein
LVAADDRVACHYAEEAQRRETGVGGSSRSGVGGPSRGQSLGARDLMQERAIAKVTADLPRRQVALSHVTTVGMKGPASIAFAVDRCDAR